MHAQWPQHNAEQKIAAQQTQSELGTNPYRNRLTSPGIVKSLAFTLCNTSSKGRCKLSNFRTDELFLKLVSISGAEELFSK